MLLHSIICWFHPSLVWLFLCLLEVTHPRRNHTKDAGQKVVVYRFHDQAEHVCCQTNVPEDCSANAGKNDGR